MWHLTIVNKQKFKLVFSKNEELCKIHSCTRTSTLVVKVIIFAKITFIETYCKGVTSHL